MRPLGRVKPEDLKHVKLYGYSPERVEFVKKELELPRWHWNWDQGYEGACVGFGTSMMLSILNGKNIRYAARWLWQLSKDIDGLDDTQRGDDGGTLVSAACDILRAKGHRVLKQGEMQPVDKTQGIKTNRWATSVDELRSCINQRIPASIGVDWYSNFDKPVEKGEDEYWIGEGNLGSIRGGHCVCLYGADDERQAFKLKNSWGRDYPLVWIPYSTMQRLLDDWGEATLVTDL